MTLEEVMQQLESYGSEQTRKIYSNHGSNMIMFGVKVGDMKKIMKQTKTNHELAQQLYATNNVDAMYLACMIADKKKATAEELDAWVKQAKWYFVSEYILAQLTADSGFALELAPKWIESNEMHIAAAGWAAYGCYLSLEPNENIDVEPIKTLLKRIENEVHNDQNRVSFAMNNFVIAVGSYVPELTELAIQTAEKIGKVAVNMGKTACKVPLATTYIQKVVDRGSVGKKRKKARC